MIIVGKSERESMSERVRRGEGEGERGRERWPTILAAPLVSIQQKRSEEKGKKEEEEEKKEEEEGGLSVCAVYNRLPPER